MNALLAARTSLTFQLQIGGRKTVQKSLTLRSVTTTTTTTTTAQRIGKIKPRTVRKEEKGSTLAFKAGVPFVLFSVLAAWVVSNAIHGKLKEMEAWQGKTSKSVRQAKLEAEHDDMMDRLNKIVAKDFDNTKRIKRPQEILEERRLERERRNRWYRRLYRWVFRVSEEEDLQPKQQPRKSKS